MKTASNKQFLVKAVSLAFLMAAAGIGAPAWAGNFNDAVKKYNSKDYQGALNEFKAIAAQNPKNALCHYYLALCNQCLARVVEAKKEYQLATESSDPSLRGMAQAGLSQLEKVNIGSVSGSGYSSASSSSLSSAASGGGTAGAASGGDKSGSGKTASSAVSGKGAATASGAVKTIYDFYTTWCRPCKMMEPTFEEAKGRYPGISFKRFDAEAPENAALVQQFSVSAYPTIVFLDGKGKVLFNNAGALEGENFFSLIDQYNK